MTLILNGTSPGRAATPDHSSLDITGDIDLRVHVAMDDWTPAADQTLIGKYTTTSNQRSYRLAIRGTTGLLMLNWSPDGAAANVVDSTVAPTVADGAYLWVRATLDANNNAAGHTVTFYTSTDGSSWTQLGSAVVTGGTTSIFSGSADLIVGAHQAGTAGNAAGKFAQAQVYNGIGITLRANPIFSAQNYGTASFADSTGKAWTVTAPATYASTRTATLTGSGALSAATAAAVSASVSALVVTGTSPGRADTPDSATLDITGDIDLRVHVAMDDWTPSAVQGLVNKYLATGPQRAWRLTVQASGLLRLVWSQTGSATLVTVTSTVAPTVADGAPLWIRATLDVDNGASGNDVTFYTSTDGLTWTQLGATVTTAGATSIFSSTASLGVGYGYDDGTQTQERLAGKVFSAEVRSGIDGTVVANPDFASQAAGATSLVDSAGNTWTVTSPGAISAFYSPNLLSGSGIVTATAFPRYGRTANLSGSGSVTAVADVPVPSLAAPVSGEGSLSTETSHFRWPIGFSYSEKRRKDFGQYSQRLADDLKPFWYQSDTKGVTLVRWPDGTFSTVEVVTEELEATEGVRIFYGGRETVVSEDEAAELEAAGYGDYQRALVGQR
jgi:hypothetical protein